MFVRRIVCSACTNQTHGEGGALLAHFGIPTVESWFCRMLEREAFRALAGPCIPWKKLLSRVKFT